ncbi:MULTISPECIES: helix-turn-helix domain-containing protein [Bradyrhizobium]|uniref:helix-turn-helix domain-containing protein n=1 Tax=Bradyrhizobium TaxID=374 RepID=UPI0003976F19|nr:MULTISPECIES: helix-turn-helix domain-containing protein [Bradyrhizobium]ERF83758.1 MAG: adenylate cyclase [Bradyrhizobium sp. DFCI-1]
MTGNHSSIDRSVRSSAPGAPFSESDFLLQLGAAVRGARANAGMTRRELARRSGVSQRYIALIEAGKGNVSIVLLLRILNAFRDVATKAA